MMDITKNYSTGTGRHRRFGRGAATTLLAAALAMGVAVTAHALPPDGPGPETPGTSSRVWPSEVKAGDRLHFEVSGYPANETVYIKIDDGMACSDTSHGACVYHTQKLDGKGYASGSLIVPNLAPGAHWLRMLATGDVFDAKTGEKLGYQGYTRRGGNDFIVVAGGTGNPGQSAQSPGGGAVNSDGTIAGGSVSIQVDEEEATPTPTPTPEVTAVGSMDDLTMNVTDDGDSSAAKNVPANYQTQALEPAESPVPVLGISVLSGAVLVGGGGLAWALTRRNRLVNAAVKTDIKG